MRIVHAIARLNVGGSALSVLELAAGQRRRGHDVLVVAGTIPAGEESMEDVADELGVPYLHVRSLVRELSPRNDVAAASRLRSILRERRPDVLHTHTSKAGATGRVAALLAGRARPTAVIHSFHGHVLRGYFSPRRERLFRGIERTLAHAADAIVAVSDEVRNDLVALDVAPPDKVTVIPYGFDLDTRVDLRPESRTQRRAEAGAAEETLVVGFVGRLTAIKRPPDLVRTIAAVESDAMLVVVGDGEGRADAERLASTLEIADRCRFLGYRRDIGGWYGAFDALLLSSANEGAPVVAIEALAAGRPVVATDAGGTRTVVDDGETGFLAPVGDVQALAAALDRLALDPDLRRRMGELGARRMRERFSVERMVDDVERLYARVLAARTT
jgi:glycosyltransferase involved in cell wall biosynthesis